MHEMRALLFAYNLPAARHAPWLDAWSRVDRHIEAERAKKTRQKESWRGPARARRNRFEVILATAAPKDGMPDFEDYLNKARSARKRRRKPAPLTTAATTTATQNPRSSPVSQRSPGASTAGRP
ncbi:hypothetical protein ACIQU4_26445 [Streptomyces sp. NPDC090741]|uniref:hypothetical protein n=1 Tax=Streptomyces sp. NPDC090741 TaxID=3365967 RepID=UPI003827EA2F